MNISQSLKKYFEKLSETLDNYNNRRWEKVCMKQNVDKHIQTQDI